MNGTTATSSSNRRRVLQAAFGGAIVLLANRAAGTAAEPTPAPNQNPGELKSSCEQYGGVYIDSQKDDIQACFWPNKGKTVCKYNGSGCYNYDPPRSTTNPGPFTDPFGNVNWHDLEAIAGVDDTGANEPVVTPAVAAPPARKRKAHHKHRGKRRKR
ncbi:MAG: hypothetical protein R2853_06060 [Thermomicrobiales bacterium]